MYCLLYDKRTGGLYTPRGDASFVAFSNPSECISKPDFCKLVETEYETETAIKTIMYNEGFLRGTIDSSLVYIRPNEVKVFDRNQNDLLYCRYKLENRPEFLEYIKKNDLYTLALPQTDDLLFPTYEQDGLLYLLAYTKKERIPKELIFKYPKYKIVKLSVDCPVILNNELYITM